MTIAELGQLAKRAPPFRKIYGKKLDRYPDEVVAIRVLERYPKYWAFISQAERLTHQVLETPLNTKSGFFDSWSDHYANEAANIQNRDALVRLIHDTEIRRAATAQGLTVEAYIAMKALEHEVHVKLKFAAEMADIETKKYADTAHADLNAADRSELKEHYQRAYLDTQLTALYHRQAALTERRDVASRKELRLVKERIKFLEDVIYGRKTVVPDPDGSTVQGDNTTPHGSSSRGETPPSARKHARAKKSRVGF